MTPALTALDPKEVWKNFDELARIPRASTKEAAARVWVLGKARALGLETAEDKAGNIIIRKPARPGREKAPMVLLQGHLDMVCEKNEGTKHDFATDPIAIQRDGDWLKANGTTLGADNGVGVSAALAVMESTDIHHGALEFLFTIDEETGLTGAAEFPGGMLKSKYFFNLDNEEIGTLCIGCSGGLNTTARRKVRMEPAKPGSGWRLKISGLKGGHSGVDIHQGRGNALRILGRVLQALLEKQPVQLADLRGGSARNVIPREAYAILVVPDASVNDVRALVQSEEADVRADLGGFDPGVSLTFEKESAPKQALSADDAKHVADVLASCPHGVIAMSPDIAGLVQTSTNLATVAIVNGAVEIGTSQRSAIESSKLAAARTVATVCRLAGFEVEFGSRYPGWKPEPKSEVVIKLQEVHQALFGAPARLMAMHAGLECGVIGEKYPGMQLISFGPTIVDVHSPSERVQISTVQTFWNFLKATLERV
jgi:dipeptidase D